MPAKTFDIPPTYGVAHERRIMREPSADDLVSSAAGGERLEVDTELGGRYRITRFLGAGGMGDVYAARDRVLETDVALKTLRSELETSSVALERFRREIALARRMTDPHVCRVFDVGEHAGRVFFTMELLAGVPLATRVTLETLETVAAQLVRGIAALHARGIVHRDFKTSNVIVADDRVVITDFGLARSIDVRRSTHSIESGLLGTPAYLAPEQVEGRPATTASDVYALGVVLFELATGKRPFDNDGRAMTTARLTREPPKPSSLRSDLPPSWDAIILRCLARDPAARPAIDDVLGKPRLDRRWFLAAGVLGLAAAGLGTWRFTRPAVQPLPPDALVVVVPSGGDASTELVRMALDVDLQDALGTTTLWRVPLEAGAMAETLDAPAIALATVPDPTLAAFRSDRVAAVVRICVEGSEQLAVTLDVQRRNKTTESQALARPIGEATLLVDDLARAISTALGVAAPRTPPAHPRFQAMAAKVGLE